MSRDWIGVYSRIARLPKFRRLSDAAQLTLIYTWLLAGDTEPEATWSSLGSLGDVLELTGRPRDALEELEELVERQWLDVDPNGTVTVHDWDEWQYAATQAGRRAWEAHYMREWRKRPPKAKPDLTGPVPDLKRSDLTGVNNGSSHVNNKTTCPGCGDLLDDKDPNVVVGGRGNQLWHRMCPAAPTLASRA